jgi:hypothetical protein
MASKKEEESDLHLLEEIQEMFDRGSKAKFDKVAEWDECRAFYQGDQWSIPGDSGQRKATAKEPWRVRLTVNKLPSRVENALAIYLGVQPIIMAIPPTEESDDRKAALVSNRLLEYYWDELCMQDRVLPEALEWALVCGDGFARPTWDTTKGEPMDVPVELDEEGSATKTEVVNAGDLAVESVSPYCVTVEPGCEFLEDAAWMMITEAVLREDVLMRFGKKELSEKQPESDSASQAGGKYIPSIMDNEKLTKERCILQTTYWKPNSKFKKGRVVYSTPYEILRKEDELPFGEYPLVHIQDIHIPGQFWGSSKVSQAIPLQAGYNRLRSSVVEVRNLMGNPGWLEPEEAEIARGTISNKPGAVIKYRATGAGGAKPERIQGVSVPQSSIQELGLFEEELNDVMSRHEASQGRMSSDVTSGRQAAIYREADNSRYMLSLRKFEKALAKLARFMLRFIKKNMGEERTIAIIGRGRSPEFLSFTKEDVSDRANIKFEISSQQPWNPELGRQTAFALFDKQVIDRKELLMRLQSPTPATMFEPEQDHRLNARLENEMMSDGQIQIMPMPTDNHAVHVEEHEAVLNDPDKRAELHLERIQYQRDLQMAKQAGMLGQQIQVPQPKYMMLLQHLDAHRKAIPPPPPPPPLTKINLNGEIAPNQAAGLAGAGMSQQPKPSSDGKNAPRIPNKSAGSQASMPQSDGSAMTTPAMEEAI